MESGLFSVGRVDDKVIGELVETGWGFELVSVLEGDGGGDCT